jgi:single-strand selective monofunctional uracil DNA glycosylase
MAQTGVPFGDIVMVREWLGIEGAVGHPPREHPKRPVEGFAIRRREGSGTRLWGWARERFGTPEAFFARYFVMNYCPLLFLTSEAGNVTPDKLRVGERAALFAACDAALRATVVTVGARLVVGVGAFARDRALAALAGADIAVGIVLHPSPANPRANAGWARLAEEQLHALGAL